MDFYGLNYLESQSDVGNSLRYGLIFGVIILLIFVTILYRRHRFETKYRDLGIIFLLFLVLILGVQYTTYRSSETRTSHNSDMVKFIKSVSVEYKVAPEKIFVNNTQIVMGTIVKIEDVYYEVNFNTNQNFYSLTEVDLIDTNITIRN